MGCYHHMVTKHQKHNVNTYIYNICPYRSNMHFRTLFSSGDPGERTNMTTRPLSDEILLAQLFSAIRHANNASNVGPLQVPVISTRAFGFKEPARNHNDRLRNPVADTPSAIMRARIMNEFICISMTRDTCGEPCAHTQWNKSNNKLNTYNCNVMSIQNRWLQ